MTLGASSGRSADVDLALDGNPVAPAFAQRASWWSFRGERLRDLALLERNALLNERFGATATYGRGAVHLLGWNPASTVALDDPWSERALDAMLRGATSRMAARAAPDTLPVPDGVRAWLTPAPPLAPLVPWIALALLAHDEGRPRGRDEPAQGDAVVALHAPHSASAGGDVGDELVPRVARREAVPRAHRRGDGAVRPRRGDGEPRGHLEHRDRAGHGEVVAGAGEHRAVADRQRQRQQGHRDERAPRRTSRRERVHQRAEREGVREEGVDLLAGSVALWVREGGVLQVKNELAVSLRDAVLIDPGASEAAWFPLIAPGVARSLDEGTPLPDVALDALVTVAPSQLPAWGSPEAQRFFVAHDGSVGDVTTLARAMGDESTAPRWRAVLATPTVPGRAHPWRDLHEPMLLARVERPVPARRDGLRVDAEETWICVRGEGKHP